MCLSQSEIEQVDGSSQGKQCRHVRIGSGLTIGPFGWFSYGGDDVCSVSADGPRAACQKHDVMWGSLKKFDGTDSAAELDTTWNPRNKLLADARFAADIVRYDCDEIVNLRVNWWAATVCGVSGAQDLSYLMEAIGLNFLASYIGSRIGNTPAWPYTQEDAQHAMDNPLFVECTGLQVTDVRVTQQRLTNGWSFETSWNLDEGCVNDLAVSEYLPALVIASETQPYCSRLAERVGRRSYDPVGVWQVGDRTFTRFQTGQLPEGCDVTSMTAYLDLSVKPDNIRWFSGKPYYEFSFRGVPLS